MWPFFFPFILHFSFKKQGGTAHKSIYSLPLNLKYCILIFGFLPTFPSVFSSRQEISWGGGNLQCCPVAGGSERAGAFASSGFCSANCSLHVGFGSLWSCSQARFPPRALRAPSPFPHQNHQLSFVWGHKAPQAGGRLQAGPQQPPSRFFRIPVCWGVNQREKHLQHLKKKTKTGKGNAFGTKKNLNDFVEESLQVLLPLY